MGHNTSHRRHHREVENLSSCEEKKMKNKRKPVAYFVPFDLIESMNIKKRNNDRSEKQNTSHSSNEINYVGRKMALVSGNSRNTSYNDKIIPTPSPKMSLREALLLKHPKFVEKAEKRVTV